MFTYPIRAFRGWGILSHTPPPPQFLKPLLLNNDDPLKILLQNMMKNNRKSSGIPHRECSDPITVITPITFDCCFIATYSMLPQQIYEHLVPRGYSWHSRCCDLCLGCCCFIDVLSFKHLHNLSRIAVNYGVFACARRGMPGSVLHSGLVPSPQRTMLGSHRKLVNSTLRPTLIFQ